MVNRESLNGGLRTPKGPCRTKNTTRSKCTTRSVLVRGGDLLSQRTLCGDTTSWELQTFFLSKKGPRRSKFGGRSKNTTA